MKKIVGGKKYDTETANLLGGLDNGRSKSDFRWKNEELYQKKTGEYFLYGEGGPLTEYFEDLGNWKGYGRDIVPLSKEDAKRLGEKILSYKEYVEAFGEPEE